VPWTGRELPAGPFAGDEGRPDPALAQALLQHADAVNRAAGADTADVPAELRATLEVAVVEALAAARVFAPIVALAGEAAEMALVTVTGADGRQALPVFSSPDALTRWRSDARPVPVHARRAALSAVAEGCELVLVDPAGPASYVVRRPALWALGQGQPWIPSYADPQVAAVIGQACAAEGLRCRLEPGAPAELRIVLGLPAGLDAVGVQAMVSRLADRLAADEVIAARVDSLDVRVHPA
jgi:hypothetical protein